VGIFNRLVWLLRSGSIKKEAGIAVYLPDEAYGHTDDEYYPSESEKFRQAVEDEFECKFLESNIGAGADVPAYVTFIGVAGVALALFFSGKRIEENFDAWIRLASRLARFFHRSPVFDRQGSAVLAVDEIIKQLGHTPKTMSLIGYQLHHFASEEEINSIVSIESIEEDPAAIYLGMAVQVFEIEVDGRLFLAAVKGAEVSVRELISDPAQSSE
jgi:hypothetical protein